MAQKNKKIKVCMFVRNNCQRDVRVLREAKTLVQNNFYVKIIAIRERFEVKPKETREGIRIKRILNSKRGTQVIRFIKYIKYWIEAFKEAMSEKSHFYYAHDLDTLLPAFLASKMKKKKLIYDSHELYTETGRGKLAKFFWTTLESTLIKSCDKVITVNDSIARELSKRYSISLPEVIRNLPMVEKDWQPRKFNFFRENFYIPEEKAIVLFYGGFGKDRGLENLILAAEKFNKSILVFMGRGELEKSLREMVRKKNLEQKVLFVPPVSQKELIYWVASADIGVIPYLGTKLNNFLCLPNKMFELIVAGVPIVANDLPELRKIIEKDGVGVLCNASSPDSIARVVNDLLSQPKEYQKIKKNIQLCWRKYKWAEEKNKYLDILKNFKGRKLK
jgi:glycosyltransferase involved in cell wall biosynthesis